jgi:hypothetical protein
MRRLFCTLLASAIALAISAQSYIKNPSFEGNPQDATVPAGWFVCEEGSTPDILPGPWGVYGEAADGDTFLGLITREDGTWESIGQRLSSPLRPNECYTFSLELAHSKTYAGYRNPLRLRVWGGATKCSKDQLLLETGFMRKAEWSAYEAEFVVKKPIHYIVIEPYYKDGKFSYQGNILIDNLSSIKKCIRASLE